LTVNANRHSFEGVPSGIVSELLEKSSADIGKIVKPFGEIVTNRAKLRDHFIKNGIIKKLTGVPDCSQVSVLGISGFSGTEKFIASEFVCAATFGVEGISTNDVTGNSQENIYRLVFKLMDCGAGLKGILNAIMLELEMELASESEHDIILIGRSPVEPFCAVIDATKKAFETKDSELSQEFLGRLKNTLASFKSLACPQNNEKILAGLSFLNSGRLFLSKLNWAAGVDDATFFSLLLEPGEFTVQVPPDTKEIELVTAIPIKDEKFAALRDSIAADYSGHRAFYYRPEKWTQAFRIETADTVYQDSGALSRLLSSITSQCCVPGINIPYPLYKAAEISNNMEQALCTTSENAASILAHENPDISSEIFRFLKG
jgi:hypothetical protein